MNVFPELQPSRRQYGFTLVEAMVAMLVLSIGLLGLAGLQASGLRSSQGAYARSQAVVLAYDIAERIRANPAETDTTAGTNSSAYNIAMGTQPSGYPSCLGSGTPPSGGACDCIGSSANCSSSNLATSDVGSWKAMLTALLAGGDGSIVQAGRSYTITVRWDEDRTGNVADLKSFALGITL